MADDYRDDINTTGRVTVGFSVTGEINSSGDEDWFAVELLAGKSYWIDLKGSSTNSGTLADPYLRGIHDSNGTIIAGTTDNDSGGNKNSRTSFTPTESGTYYIAAGANESGTGTYRLSVTAFDDFPANTSTTGRVTVDGSVTAESETITDRDWFAVTLVADTTYRIDVEGAETDAGTLPDPALLLVYDSNGDYIPGTSDNNGGTGKNAQKNFTPTESGTYYIAAGSTELASVPRENKIGTYTVSVRVAGDDYLADTGTDATATVDGSATGGIDHASDRDWFAIELNGGTTYQFDLEGSPTEAGTLADPYLRGIYDSDGNVIAGTSDDNGGTGDNSRVSFTPTATGTYYVSAGADESGTGTYTLSARVSGDDFLADTTTAGTLAVGGSATGGIGSTDDRDWFAVELVAGRTYRFDLAGSGTGDGALSTPLLTGIHDSDGVIVPGTATNSGSVGFAPTESGTFYVAAGSSSGTGAYTLSAVLTDDYSDDTSTIGAVAVGGSTTGEVNFSGDVDLFAVELEAGRTYWFDLEGSPTSKGTLDDPLLGQLNDSDGDIVEDSRGDNDSGTGKNARTEYTPTESGTYYVVVGGRDNSTGTYTLSVTGDDFTADTGTTGTVTVSNVDKAGVPNTGKIEGTGDRDWFAVELVAGTDYRFDLEAAGTDALADPYLYGIHDSDGTLVEGTADDDGGTGSNSRVIFTPTASGTHYVSAGDAGDGTGAYGLSVTTDVLTHDNTTSGRVTVDGSATGVIDSAGDSDWFAVELTAGTTYQVDLEGSPTSKGTLADPYLNGIYNSSGTLIADTSDDNGGTGNNARESFTPTASGTYYVSAGTSSGTGTYTLSVTDISTDDFTADTGTTGAVAVGGSATGRINPTGDSTSDADWFAVELAAGTTYQFDLEGSPTEAGTLANPRLLGIYDTDADLKPDTTDDDGGEGNNARVTFTPTAGGTYYVAAGGNGSTGTYALSVRDTADDFLASHRTAGAVTVETIDKIGVRNTGKVDHAGDRDWFAVELEAGTTYRFELEGTWTSDALADPYLHGIHDSSGALVAGTTDDDSGKGNNARVTFTPTESGTYYVAAGGAGDGTGTYGLSVMTDVLTHDTSTTGAVTVGGSATGTIDSGHDADWFAVQLTAGTTYRIDLEGSPTSMGTLADPYLNGIYNSNGGFIARTFNHDGGTGDNARTTFTASETATYYISAGSDGSATNIGTYTVSVEEVL